MNTLKLLPILLLLFLCSCRNGYDDGYEEGLKSEYRYQEGYAQGEIVAIKDGQEKGLRYGKHDGTNDAKTGKALELYKFNVFYTFWGVFACGVILQYVLLFRLKSTKKPSIMHLLFIPYFRYSKAYNELIRIYKNIFKLITFHSFELIQERLQSRGINNKLQKSLAIDKKRLLNSQSTAEYCNDETKRKAFKEFDKIMQEAKQNPENT